MNLKIIDKYLKIKDNIIKILTIILVAVSIIVTFLPKYNQYLNLFGTSAYFPNRFLNIYIVFVKQAFIASTIYLILNRFFNSYKVKIISSLFSLVSYLLYIFSFSEIIKTHENYWLFIVAIVFILVAGLTYSIMNFIDYLQNIKKYKLKEYLISIPMFVSVMLMSSEPYLYKIVFGRIEYKVAGFNFVHLLAIFMPIIVSVLLIKIIFYKSLNTKKLILILISISSLYSFYSKYSILDFKLLSNLPFHLYYLSLIPLFFAILFRIKKIFYFSYTISVIGPLWFILFPNSELSSLLFSTDNVTYFLPHIYNLVIPVLAVGINYFEKPKPKHVIISLSIFTFYYLLIIFLNTWFINFDANVDYFNLTKNSFIDSFFLVNIRKNSYVINLTTNVKLKLYYVFYLVVYLSFIISTLLFVALNSYMFGLHDSVVYMGYKMKFQKENKINFKEKIDDELKEKLKMSKAHVKVSSFSKKYLKNDFYSVKNVSFEITEGKIVGFVGHNGAGKSTLIKSIVGIQTISEGKIEICGNDISKNPTQAKYLLGYVSDNHALYEELTAREYITFVGKLYNVHTDIINQKLVELANFFHITKDLDRQIRTFSHGMKQKISVISSLIHEPKVWVLDEPLTGLDPTSSYQLKQAIKDHAKKGNIVIFSSHIIEVVENLCDEIVIIKRGQMILNDSIKNLKNKYSDLESLYINLMENK